MEELDNILRNATARVAAEYLRLPIHGQTPAYRERVYCYELYHQMRCAWPKETPYRLNAEVDKRGHIAMGALGVRGQKPDLLVHIPGYMDGNHTIVEVKAAPSDKEKIGKDLKTLATFLKAGYERAIYLIYGEKADARMLVRVLKFAENVDGIAGTEIWFHSAPQSAAERVAIIN